MSSMADMIRAGLVMSDEEENQLLVEGWRPEVVRALRSRGFRPCAPHPDDGRTPGFLRQTAIPHIRIALDHAATLEELDTAIFEAGGRFRHERLADRWHAFTQVMQNWRVAPDAALDARISVLENKLKELTES